MIQPQEPSSFSGGSRAKVHGPRSQGRAAGSAVKTSTGHASRSTVHGTWRRGHGPQTTTPSAHSAQGDVARATALGPQTSADEPLPSAYSAHSVQGRCYTGPAPRSLVLGPKLQPRSGNAETVEASCALATSPNEIRASRIWRPNKIGACLQQGGPKRGGGGPAGSVFAGVERLELPRLRRWGGGKSRPCSRGGRRDSLEAPRAKNQWPRAAPSPTAILIRGPR